MNQDADTGGKHMAAKPIILPTRAIKNSSDDNGVVLDLFLGSGTTLIAAEQLGRVCYGMEINEKYCDIIVKCWEQYTGKKAERITKD